MTPFWRAGSATSLRRTSPRSRTPTTTSRRTRRPRWPTRCGGSTTVFGAPDLFFSSYPRLMSQTAPGKRYRALWSDAVLADSENTIVVEGNQYFPTADVNARYLRPSESHTTCHWKGV